MSSGFDVQQDKTASLSASERSLAFKLAENPMELFQGKTVGWLEDFIRITVGTGGRQEGTGENVTGHFAWVAKDLSAQTLEYVYEDDSGRYLFTNGVYVSTITYVDLYEYFGPNCYGPDIGDTFKLPDSRGRAAFFCGTHANTGLGDNDGIALSSRQVFHQHTADVTVSGATSSNSAGTPSGSISASFTGSALGTHTHTDSGHTHGPPSGQQDFWGGDPVPGSEQFAFGTNYKSHNGGTTGSGNAAISSNSAGTPAGSVSASFTGSALSTHAHTFSGTGSGTAGSGMSSDGPAHIYIGSLVVRF